MSEAQAEPPTTALTVIERAQIALKSAKTEQDFKALVEQSKTITAITNGDGYKQCHASRMSLVRARTTLETLDETVREDLVATNKAIIAERKRLVAIVQPEEQRLDKLQKAYDETIASEKRAKAEAEAKRVADIQKRIEDDIRCVPVHAAARSAKDVAVMLGDIEAIVVDDSFQEFKQQAEGAKATTLVKLRMMLAAAEKLEAEQKRLAEERAELARQKAAEEIRQAQERERIAEEQRAAKKAADAEAARQAEVLRRQREEQEAENTRIRLENEARTTAERKRIEAEEEALERRAEAQRAESERLETERKKLAREQAEADAARQAEAQRLANERAELERQQSALKLSQETVAAPSDPVEATKADAVQAIVDELNAPADGFPSNDEIIHAVAQAFFVPESTAVEYILRVADECRQMEAA